MVYGGRYGGAFVTDIDSYKRREREREEKKTEKEKRRGKKVGVGVDLFVVVSCFIV